MSQEETKPINKNRLAYSLGYFALAVPCFIWIVGDPEKVFYTDVGASTWHLYRLLWCAFATVLGFASVALTLALRGCKSSPYPKYLTHYPVQICIIATAAHGLLHCFEGTSGFVFYYLSLSICFYCGYHIDFWQKKISEVLGRS